MSLDTALLITEAISHLEHARDKLHAASNYQHPSGIRILIERLDNQLQDEIKKRHVKSNIFDLLTIAEKK